MFYCTKQSSNKKRSRTAIFSLSGAQKRFINHTTNHFYKKNTYGQKDIDKNIVGRSQERALEKYEFKKCQNRNNKWTFWHVRFSKDQSKRQNYILFHLKAPSIQTQIKNEIGSFGEV